MDDEWYFKLNFDTNCFLNWKNWIQVVNFMSTLVPIWGRIIGSWKNSKDKQKSNIIRINLMKNKSNIRHTWSTIKEILNKCKNKKEFPPFFTIKDEHVTDKMDISNNFNSFFANIGTNLSNNIKYSGNKTISSYLKQRVISSCVTSTEVTIILKNLASKNSSVHDGISARFIKRILLPRHLLISSANPSALGYSQTSQNR